jgi:putative toxin-antitoxin system antitoxin component (TIGR02293 family)
MPIAIEQRVITRDVARLRDEIRQGRPNPHSYVRLLGLKPMNTPQLVARVREGFSIAAFERFRRNVWLTSTQLADLVRVPQRTLARRKDEGQLRPDESDRLLRVARLFGRAMELFEGDAQEAWVWLMSPNRALGDTKPLEAAETEVGAREVDDLIGRLEHGVIS